MSVHGLLDALDPRVRVLSVLLFAMVVISLNRLDSLLAALWLALLLLAFSQVSRRQILQRLLLMDGLMLGLLLTLPFSTPGETVFTLAGWPASREGLEHALHIFLKSNSIMLALLSLLGTLEASCLGRALYHLKVPVKLVHLLLFTIRYLDVLKNEYARLRISMKARGFQLRNNLHTYKSIGYLFGMLLVRTLHRCERILMAMRCRGFDGRLHLLATLSIRRVDIGFAAVFIVALALIGLLEYPGMRLLLPA
ncbi:cobalt ECF transporter T component CbiQ [Thiorhodospira sibirica]|uniref:cobalt ECF transporter T component CbiQ n=1 Tax=Thiorhodospira sibirica TaxID=154347 RepID=UPI00022C0B29|nr:cobalt ECF transporter T component CbiQ [Thiorhodospira sibirica]